MIESPSRDLAAKATSTNDEAVRDRDQELARVIEARVLQGYRVVSISEGRAVLAVKGRKRLLGFRGGEDHETELTIGEHGRVVTRNI